MEKLILFLKIISWIAAPISTFIFGACVYMNIKYPGSIDEMMDRIKGVTRSYPSMPWLIVAIVSWAFLIVF